MKRRLVSTSPPLDLLISFAYLGNDQNSASSHSGNRMCLRPFPIQ